MQDNQLFKPLKKSARSSELLAEEIRRLIIDGHIKPGDHLPPERDLAQRFNVTRNTVREALRSLEQLRLVSIRQGSGITVQDYLATAGFDFVAELLLGDQKNIQDLMADIAAAWSVVGLAMMQYAIENFNEEFLPNLATAVADFEKEANQAMPDRRRLQELDFEIQNRLMHATGNQAMVLLHNSIRHIYSAIADLFEPIAGNPGFLAANFTDMLACLEAGNRQGAKQAFEKYFRLGKEALEGKNKTS